MQHICRFFYCGFTTFLVMFLTQASAYAQSGGEDGKELLTPYMMGNIIVVLFAIGLFALAVKSSRRDFSAIPDEFGNRPNAKNQKKKKGKQKLDFSHGPIQHPDLNNALILTLLTWLLCNLLIFFSLPAAIRVRDEIRGDPRFTGGGMAQTLVVINYIFIVLFIIGFVAGLIIGFMGAAGGDAGA